MTCKSKLALPLWTRDLPNKTLISAKEVSSFFGYKSASSLHRIVAHGRFPKHVSTSIKNCLKGRFIAFHWSLGSLRSYELEQNKDNK